MFSKSMVTPDPAPPARSSQAFQSPYHEALDLIERLHGRLFELIKFELDKHRRRDITPMQAFILYKMGDREMSATETQRECYLGTNVAYNLKKLVNLGLIKQHQNPLDRRCVCLKSTDRGKQVASMLEKLFDVYASVAKSFSGLSPQELTVLNGQLRQLDRFMFEKIGF